MLKVVHFDKVCDVLCFYVLYTQVTSVQNAVNSAPMYVGALRGRQPLLQVTAQLTTSQRHSLQHLQRAHILRLKQAHLLQ